MKEGQPFIAFGTPGAAAQTVTLTQIVLNLVDFGMDVQSAIEAPRWAVDAQGNRLLEQGLDPEVCAQLAAMGHKFEVAEKGVLMFGSTKVVLRDPASGTLFAGADNRRNGYAVGL
jgi:gamma-glutamyltranspeptidase/glutathione hydrolase